MCFRWPWEKRMTMRILSRLNIIIHSSAATITNYTRTYVRMYSRVGIGLYTTIGGTLYAYYTFQNELLHFGKMLF